MAITKASDLAKLLADGVVGTTEIGDGQITTAKIADSAITTDKLASNAVTAAQLSVSGDDIPYDNSVSGMSANTLQEAIDYLNVVTGGGSAGAQATYTRDSFIATEGQTTFTTSNGYTLGYVQVFMNGVLLALTDYVANNESTVVLNVGASAGDEIAVIAYDSFAISEVLRVLSISPSSPDDALTITAEGGIATLSGITASATIRSLDTVVGLQHGTFAGEPSLQTVASPDDDYMRLDLDGSGVGAGMHYLISYGDTHVNNGELALKNNTGDPIVFYTGTVSTPRVSVRGDNGDLRLETGTQLEFADGSVMSEYEHGTWTPVYNNDSGFSATTVTSHECRYVKVGRIVHLTGTLRFDSADGSIAQNNYIRITGVPFGQEQMLTESVQEVGTCHLYNSLGGGVNAWGRCIYSEAPTVLWFYFPHIVGTVTGTGAISFTITYEVD